MNTNDLKISVIEAGKKLVEMGLIARTWGNVSCRLNESSFLVTPSGMDYLSLTPDDIVAVNISDCSYTGNIKPSSEKGVHAEVYKLFSEVNFVIHTHQDNASVVSTLGMEKIKISGGYSHLGNEIVCASYGLPGTKKLRRGVSEALSHTSCNAVIMKNHGVLCFGKNMEEAFRTALELENASDSFIAEQYLKLSKRNNFDINEMRQYCLSKLTGQSEIYRENSADFSCESKRTEKGFKLQIKNGETFEIHFGQSEKTLSLEAKIHYNIFKQNKNINFIIHSNMPDINAVSCCGIKLRPILDDFAQIVGTSVSTFENDTLKIASALKSSSAVFIRNNGALCCGSTRGDAHAAEMILEKNCKALLASSLFGRIEPISHFDSILMRFIYLKKYSKKINKTQK